MSAKSAGSIIRSIKAKARSFSLMTVSNNYYYLLITLVRNGVFIKHLIYTSNKTSTTFTLHHIHSLDHIRSTSRSNGISKCQTVESRVCSGSQEFIMMKRRLESSGPTRRVVEVTPSPLRIRRSESRDVFSWSVLHRL